MAEEVDRTAMPAPAAVAGLEQPLAGRQTLAIGLISFVLLGLQLTLMRSIAYAHGHHLAYVVISLGLLGFGASGSVFFVLRARTAIPPQWLLLPALLCCGVTSAWLVPLVTLPMAGFTVDLLGTDSGQWLRLMLLGLQLFLPFFFGALAIAVVFTAESHRIGPLYGANLLGSAAGAAGALALLHLTLPENILPWFAVGAWCAAFAASSRPMPAGERRLLALAAVVILPGLWFSGALPLSSYKDVSYALRLPDVEHRLLASHPFGRVETATSAALRHAPDLSLHYRGPVPAPPVVFVDGQTAGYLLSPEDPAGVILAHTPRALPYVLGEVRRVWILAPGGTPAINLALARGATVVVAEPHPSLARLLEQTLGEGHGVEVRAGVAPRSLFMAPLPAADRPQLIIFPTRGFFGGPVGLQAVAEDFLFTVEAVVAALSRLAPGGQLLLTVWLDEPLRHGPRLVDLAASALRTRGVATPGGHLAVVRGWGSLAITVGVEPLSPGQIAATQQFVRDAGFDLLWPVASGNPPRLHSGEGDLLDRIVASLLGAGRQDFLFRYRFAVAAPVDDRPFFNQFQRPGEVFADLVAGTTGATSLSLSEQGLTMVIAILLLLVLASVLLIFGPLLLLPGIVRERSFTLLYFAGIGAGFMFVEIALIQRFTLLWGSPLYSAAGVISALLVGMGAGSLCSQRFVPRPLRLAAVTALAAGLQVILLLATGILSRQWLELPTTASVSIGLIVLAVPAFVMGMPFPLGIRLLAERAPLQIPWACAVNGCLSVLGATAAGLVALTAGFSGLVLFAGGAYLAAALAAVVAYRRWDAGGAQL